MAMTLLMKAKHVNRNPPQIAPTMTMKFEENKRLASGHTRSTANRTKTTGSSSIDVSHLGLAFLKRPVTKVAKVRARPV